MSRMRSPSFHLLAFAVGLLGLFGCRCEEPAPALPVEEPIPEEAAWGEVGNGLQLRLALDRGQYHAGDPIAIAVEAKNIGTDELVLSRFEDQTWWYHVTFENLGEGPDFLGGAGLFIDFAEPPDAVLTPGSRWKKEAELGDERRRFLRIVENRQPGDDWDYRPSLPPGRYRAWLEYAYSGSEVGLWKGRVRTNEVVVEIVPAEGE